MRNGATQPNPVSRSTWYSHAQFRNSNRPRLPQLEEFLVQQNFPLDGPSWNPGHRDQPSVPHPDLRSLSRSPPNKRQRVVNTEGMT